MTQLENASIAAGPGREARADLGEEPGERIAFADLAGYQTTGVQISATRQRDQLLRVRPELLGLGFGGDHFAMEEKTGRHGAQQRTAVFGGARELASLGLVTH